MKSVLALLAALAVSAGADAGSLTEKIREKHEVVRTDVWFGGDRTVFKFDGREAWVVEPPAGVAPAKGNPWTWTIQWHTAFVARTPAPKLISSGWRHVWVNGYDLRGTEEGLKMFAAFQKYLVDDLGFAPKACLIGMSWGGFFSTRYTAAYPQNVKAIYLDAPLLNFAKFSKSADPEVARKSIGPWADSIPANSDWTHDPRMPVNLADKVAAAKAPILLLYGGSDQVVPPSVNCEMFVPRFKAAGGNVKVVKRGAYAHHPHGVELDDWSIAKFFQDAWK